MPMHGTFTDSDIARARAVRIEDLARQRKFKLKREGAEWVGPCPRCGGTDRFAIKPASQEFHCRGCDYGSGGAIDFIIWLDGVDFHEAVEILIGAPSGPRNESSRRNGQASKPPPPDEDAEDAARNTDYAGKIWDRAEPIGGTLAEVYLEWRGLDLPDDDRSLRFSPSLLHKRSGESYPAMIAAVHDVDGQFRGIHRTWLASDGQGKAPVEKPRMTLGPIKGCAIRLAKAGPVLLLSEGIEDALSGMQATGLPAWAAGSSGGFGSVELPPVAAGVILLANNDEAGDKSVLAGGPWLEGQGRTVRVARPPHGINDFNELWQTADGRDAAAECIDRAHPWRDDRAAAGLKSDDPGGDELGEWDAGADAVIPPPRGWLLGNTFCRGFGSSLLGDGGVGKTALRYAQALSLATGRPLTGEHVHHRARVLIVSLEDSADELRRRILAARIHHGIEREDIRGWLFLVALGAKGGKLMDVDKGHPVPGTLPAKLSRTITARRIDLVMLDPFVKAHAVNENDNNGIDQVASLLCQMAIDHDIAADVSHHMNKGPGDPGNASKGRGASALKDALRLVRTATVMTADEAKKFGLDDAERRRLIRVDDAKLNIAPPAEATWFRLVGVPIGNGNDLYPTGDSVQTVEVWTPPELFADVSTGNIHKILDEIEAGLPDGNRYSNASNTDRSAWRVVQKHCPQIVEGPARRMIQTWLKSGLLVEKEYDNPRTWKKVKGLWVDNLKRPS